jgi:UDP-3-O-[3-hydroxymyristoyl] N-acetylglucosamine deacetylase
VFRRVDLPEPVDIPVNAKSVTDTRLASTISNGGAKVNTIEHLMSACAGLGLDNLYRHHGRRGAHPRRLVGVVRLPAAERGHRDAEGPQALHPREKAGRGARGRGPQPQVGAAGSVPRLQAGFEIEFDHPAVNATGQRVEFDMGSGRYAREIARARTFGFTRDVEMMRSHGLAWAAAWTTPS